MVKLEIMFPDTKMGSFGILPHLHNDEKAPKMHILSQAASVYIYSSEKLIGLNLVLRTPNDTSKTANIQLVNPIQPLPGCP
jgi:hypothetical protein